MPSFSVLALASQVVAVKPPLIPDPGSLVSRSPASCSRSVSKSARSAYSMMTLPRPLWSSMRTLSPRARCSRSAISRTLGFFVESRDRLRQPLPLRIASAVPHRGSFRGEFNIHLPPVCRMRLALDHPSLFQRGNRRAHRLRLHALRACQVGRGRRPFSRQPRHYRRFRQRKLMRSRRRPHSPQQPPNCLQEIDHRHVQILSPHSEEYTN